MASLLTLFLADAPEPPAGRLLLFRLSWSNIKRRSATLVNTRNPVLPSGPIVGCVPAASDAPIRAGSSQIIAARARSCEIHREVRAAFIEKRRRRGTASPCSLVSRGIPAEAVHGGLGGLVAGQETTGLQVLWEAAERVFCRGRRLGADDIRRGVLVVLSAPQPPPPTSLSRLAHEWGPER